MTLTTDTIDLNTPTGTMRCYQYQPKAVGRYPAILFYSEIFQLTAPIARMASFLAGHGFIVLVPEIFHELNPIGTVLGYDDIGKNKGNADKASKPLSQHDSDTTSMVDYLKNLEACSGQIGSMGVCIGGHLAFRAALNPHILSASCLYATDLHSDTLPAPEGENTLSQCGKIQGEVQMIFGQQDPHVPLAGRRLIQEHLQAKDVCFTWHEFNAAHAFMRDEGERYDPALARLCWQLALDLFHRTLF